MELASLRTDQGGSMRQLHRREAAPCIWRRSIAFGLSVLLFLTGFISNIPRASAEGSGAPAGLTKDLATLDRQLAKLISDYTNGKTGSNGRPSSDLAAHTDFTDRVKEISADKQAMVNQYFGQSIYGVKFSETFKELDCLDSRLYLALGQDGWTHLTRERVAMTMETGKACKQKLETELSQATQAAPKVSMGTLHSFDISPSQQSQLAVAATTSGGVNTTAKHWASTPGLSKTLITGYVKGGFLGRHERDYIDTQVTDAAKPDSWPISTTGLYFVTLDLFKSSSGATAAGAASNTSLINLGFKIVAGSSLPPGEVALQKESQGSDILNTVVSIDRGPLVVGIASACRGCNEGTVPPAVGTFVKDQLANIK